MHVVSKFVFEPKRVFYLAMNINSFNQGKYIATLLSIQPINGMIKQSPAGCIFEDY